MNDGGSGGDGSSPPALLLPLVVDLDGTLVRTDTLIEALLRVLAVKPLALLKLFLVLRQGRAAFKQAVARAFPLPPASLPYNDAVLAVVHRARAEGRRVYLATAADRAVAGAVAAHLGLFDGVMSSDGRHNLRGREKAAALVAAFGARGFSYAGDSAVDLPVWRAAARALVVHPSPRLLALAQVECSDTVVIGAAPALPARLLALARALRVHQWAKNLLVFVPIFAGHYLAPGFLLRGVLAFAAFSLVASSVYVLNDLLDLPHDRAHPSKFRRPFASGDLALAAAPGLIAGTLGIGAAIAVLLPGRFAVMLGLYLAGTLLYSFVLKRRMVWDVMTLAGLYTMRIFAGSAATGIPISPWLLAFSMFLFFCLAIVKRQTELGQHVRDGGTEKIGGRAYLPEDLDMLRSMAAASGYMAVLVLALYVNSPDVRVLYHHPKALWGLCPMLLFWVSRVLMLSNRGLMNDDPVVFALRDRVSLACGVVALGVFAAGAL